MTRAAWILLFVLNCSNASDAAPIPVVNSLPVMAGAGLNKPKSASLLDHQEISASINAVVQSHANDAGSPNEDLILDGEVHTLDISLKWGFAPDWQASINAAGIRNTSGQFDGLIDEWHDLLSLNTGDRSQQARDQFRFLYRSENSSIELSEPSSGITDTTISLGHQLIESSEWQLALYADVNLPTGKSNRALGSEKADYALSLAAAKLSHRFTWHANIRALLIGDESLFGIPTENTAWASSLGLHWQASDKWRWSTQLDGHGAVFKSAIDEINQPAWQMSLAGERTLGAGNSSIQVFFTEDVSVNRAADFSFGAALNFTL